MNAPANEPAGDEWFGSDSADVPLVGDSPAAARTAADPNNAVANAAAGMLGGVLMEKVPMLGHALNKVTSTLNISENMKQLTYGPWGDFLMPAGGYSRPTPQELRGKVMTNVGSYGGCVRDPLSSHARQPPPRHGTPLTTGITVWHRNYLTLGSGLSVAGIFFHPTLLLLIGVLYYAHRRSQSEEQIVVMSRTLGRESPPATTQLPGTYTPRVPTRNAGSTGLPRASLISCCDFPSH